MQFEKMWIHQAFYRFITTLMNTSHWIFCNSMQYWLPYKMCIWRNIICTNDCNWKEKVCTFLYQWRIVCHKIATHPVTQYKNCSIEYPPFLSTFAAACSINTIRLVSERSYEGKIRTYIYLTGHAWYMTLWPHLDFPRDINSPDVFVETSLHILITGPDGLASFYNMCVIAKLQRNLTIMTILSNINWPT